MLYSPYSGRVSRGIFITSALIQARRRDEDASDANSAGLAILHRMRAGGSGPAGGKASAWQCAVLRCARSCTVCAQGSTKGLESPGSRQHICFR